MQPIIKGRTNAGSELEALPVALPELSPRCADARQSDEDDEAPVSKEVRLVRIEGEVRGIEVRCACGEWTLVELNYEAAAAAGSEDQ